jgi:hypothetical protein
MANENAQTAFIQAVENCRQLIEQLSAHAGDHLGCDPDEIHYGHVGDARRLEGALHAACEASGLKSWSVNGQNVQAEE